MHFDATFFALLALVIFLGIAAYAGAFKSMGSGLDARAARIQRELEHASKLRKEAEALLAEYKQKRLDAEKEAEAIISAARSDAEEYAAETRRKLTESLDRRSKQAEQKIAQAEAQASNEVRAAAADAAVKVAERVLARGDAAKDFVAAGINEVKALADRARHLPS